MALIDNLLAYYKYSGNTTDSSGNGHSPTGQNISYISGILGTSASFNGSSSYIPDDGYGYGLGATTHSFAAWFKIGPTEGGNLFTASVNTSNEDCPSLNVSSSGVSSSTSLNRYSSGPSITVSTNTNYADSNWHYAVVTITSGTDMYLYVDGSQVDYKTSASSAVNTSINRMYVGRRAWENGSYFSGAVDGLAFWSRALSGSEVTQLYNSGNGLDYPFTGVDDLYINSVYDQVNVSENIGSEKSKRIFSKGNGSDGSLNISSSVAANSVKSNITALANYNSSSVTVASSTGFSSGDMVFIIQMQGTGAGNYEFNTISSISSNTINLLNNTSFTYQSTKAQVIKVNQYTDVTVKVGGTWTPNQAWDGTKGGVLVAVMTGSLVVDSGGSINASGYGFAGGTADGIDCNQGYMFGSVTQGDSPNGTGTTTTARNGGGGGGGAYQYQSYWTSGGGGGYGSAGNTYGSPTEGGTTYGSADLSGVFLGSGGGGGKVGGTCSYGGGGGTGGGAIFIIANTILINGGTIKADGSNGASHSTFPWGDAGTGGGGGSGGAIRLLSTSLTLGTGKVTASGGAGGEYRPAAGGVGRIGTLSSTTVSGTSSPTIDTTSTDILSPEAKPSDSLNISEYIKIELSLPPINVNDSLNISEGPSTNTPRVELVSHILNVEDLSISEFHTETLPLLGNINVYDQLNISENYSEFRSRIKQNSFYGTSYSVGPNPGSASFYLGGFGDTYYDFFQFNLDNTTPANETESAILAIYTPTAPNNAPSPIVERVTSDWDEGTLSRTVNPTIDTGTNYPFSPTWGQTSGWKYCDITALYKQWKDGTYTNFGVRVKPVNTNDTTVIVYSSYYSDPALRPKFIITATTRLVDLFDSMNVSELWVSSMLDSGAVVVDSVTIEGVADFAYEDGSIYSVDQINVSELTNTDEISYLDVTDSIDISEEPIVIGPAYPTFNESFVEISEFVSVSNPEGYLFSDGNILIEDIAEVEIFKPILFIFTDDLFLVIDSATPGLTIPNLNVVDQINISEFKNIEFPLDVIRFENLNISETNARETVNDFTVYENIGLLSSVQNTELVSNIIKIDNLSISELVLNTLDLSGISKIENISISEIVDKDLDISVSKYDDIQISELLINGYQSWVEDFDSIQITEETNVELESIVSVIDNIMVHENFGSGLFFGIDVSDEVSISENIEKEKFAMAFGRNLSSALSNGRSRSV